MASPGVGKRIHPLPYTADINQLRKFFFLLEVVLSVCFWLYVILITGFVCFHFAANVRVVDPVREYGSPGLGNVAWKERVDGWKMKQEKNVVPMSTGQAPSERGVGDIDACTDVLVDDSLL